MSAAQAPTPLAALAARARTSPHDPWLFYNEGWDWPWRSWSRVADQVARGEGVLRERVSPEARVGFESTQDPDAIAVGLAIQAAGAIAVPIAGSGQRALAEAARQDCVIWAESADESRAETTGEPLERVALPAALSPLERTAPRPLEVDLMATPDPVMSEARALDALLPREPKRPILCVDPALDHATTQAIQAWTLVRDAAWVLEPETEELLPTYLWARPTLIIARAEALDRLAALLQHRKHRRGSRLLAVVGVAEDGAPETTEDLWENLEIPYIALPG